MIYVDSEGVVRDGGGQRIEGIEVIGEVPPGGGKVTVNLMHPVVTDEDGQVDGVDMTVAENRRRLHNARAGITETDERELEGRLRTQPKLVFDRGEEQGDGKRWKHEGKWPEPLDPTVVHETPKFPLGSVMVVRGKRHDR